MLGINADYQVARKCPRINLFNISKLGATVRWQTNRLADSQVEYGLTTAYGKMSPLKSSLSTIHLINLGNLTPGALYHYRVRSKDAAGNLIVSGDFTFRTTIN
jgi:hypothetical protein